MKKPILLTAALLILTTWVGQAAGAASAPSVEELFTALKNANPGLTDYQSDIHIDLHVNYLVAIPLDLHGKYYYKRPDHYKLVLEHAPQFVQKYPQIFGWNLPKLEDFNSRIVGQENVDGLPCWHVFLTPRHEMGDLQGQELWIDRQAAVFPRQIVHYRDAGQILIEVKYTTKDQYHLFDTMKAAFSFPKIHLTATADASYSNYLANQKLPDAFFKSGP
ncbi:MAG TPA: hypothetical protein VGO93_13950 [Candidatus Xenobia bacterium]|jgi:hypothetical protein